MYSAIVRMAFLPASKIERTERGLTLRMEARKRGWQESIDPVLTGRELQPVIDASGAGPTRLQRGKSRSDRRARRRKRSRTAKDSAASTVLTEWQRALQLLKDGSGEISHSAAMSHERMRERWRVGDGPVLSRLGCLPLE